MVTNGNQWLHVAPVTLSAIARLPNRFDSDDDGRDGEQPITHLIVTQWFSKRPPAAV